VHAVSGVVGRREPARIRRLGQCRREVDGRPLVLLEDGAVHPLADVLVTAGAQEIVAAEDRGDRAEDRLDTAVGGPAGQAEQAVDDLLRGGPAFAEQARQPEVVDAAHDDHVRGFRHAEHVAGQAPGHRRPDPGAQQPVAPDAGVQHDAARAAGGVQPGLEVIGIALAGVDGGAVSPGDGVAQGDNDRPVRWCAGQHAADPVQRRKRLRLFQLGPAVRGGLAARGGLARVLGRVQERARPGVAGGVAAHRDLAAGLNGQLDRVAGHRRAGRYPPPDPAAE
jgi:hypothetical protein